MREFHHIGIPVEEKTPEMVYYQSIKCWASDPDATPGRIEYIFFEPDTSITEQEALETLEAKLFDAVGARMVADVPLGTTLSGGVDSSLVTAIMSRISSAPVKTFNVALEAASHDESEYAQIVAEAIGRDVARQDGTACTCVPFRRSKGGIACFTLVQIHIAPHHHLDAALFKPIVKNQGIVKNQLG